MRLNLGCGTNKFDDFINVDRSHSPDVIHDLEVFPWPWPDSTVDHIRAHHVLEHLGATPAIFIGVMKELHRVCKGGAVIDIVVPHPRSDDFLDDPTHVRPITPRMLGLFSKSLNRKWRDEGWSDSQLGLEHDVDFEVTNVVIDLERHVQEAFDRGAISHDQVSFASRECNNIVKQFRITLKCIK